MGTKVSVHVANGYTEPIWVKVTKTGSGITIPRGGYTSEGFTLLGCKRYVRVEPNSFVTIVSSSRKTLCKAKPVKDCGIIVNKSGDVIVTAFRCIWTDRLGRGHEF